MNTIPLPKFNPGDTVWYFDSNDKNHKLIIGAKVREVWFETSKENGKWEYETFSYRVGNSGYPLDESKLFISFLEAVNFANLK